CVKAHAAARRENERQRENKKCTPRSFFHILGRAQAMRDRRSYLLLLALVAGGLALAPATARAAEENLLHGPHPFLKDNEISVHALIGEGQGDAMSGAKLQLDYGYKLTAGTAPWWLNLLISFEDSSCNATPNAAGSCPEVTGDIVETM